ncbi:leucine-rich repeat protein [Parabacteroides sp.]
MNEFLHIGAGHKMNVLLVLAGLLLSSAHVAGSTGLASSEAADATLKSLSYKIGEDGYSVPVNNFKPDTYNYEVPYNSNEDAISQGMPPVYTDAQMDTYRIYPVAEPNDPDATLVITDVPLKQGGLAKVQVTSADKTKTNTYTFFLVSRKDAGKKYYVVSELEHLTLEADSFKVSRDGRFVGKLVPESGYELPQNITVEYGSDVQKVSGDIYSSATGEINLNASWHMLIRAKGVKESDFFVADHVKYQITSSENVAVIGTDVEDNATWTVTDCIIPATVSKDGKSYRVTELGEEAFIGCKKLKSITLPAGLTTIGERCFAGCVGTLTEMHCLNPVPAVFPKLFFHATMEDLFNSSPVYDCVLYVPSGSKAQYAQAEGWKNFGGILEEGEMIEPVVGETTDSTMTVTCNTFEQATGYIVKVYEDAAKTRLKDEYQFDADGKLRSSSFSFTIEGLSAGRTYYIETMAVREGDYPTPIIISQNTIEVKTTGTATGNEGVTVDRPVVCVQGDEVVIRATGGILVRIYDLSGQCIVAGKVAGYGSFQLAKGLYIVVAGEESHKIVIR